MAGFDIFTRIDRSLFLKNSTIHKIHDERQNIRRPFNDFKAYSPALQGVFYTQRPVDGLDF